MLESYSEAVEKQMQEFHRRLPEKNRRLYAGIEALKLPRGGISYIADLFGCSRVTVRCGIKELGDEETLSQSRNRKIGGGRLSVLEKYPAINDVFLTLFIRNSSMQLICDRYYHCVECGSGEYSLRVDTKSVSPLC